MGTLDDLTPHGWREMLLRHQLSPRSGWKLDILANHSASVSYPQ